MFWFRKNDEFTIITKYGYFNLLNNTGKDKYILTKKTSCSNDSYGNIYWQNYNLMQNFKEFLYKNPDYIKFYIESKINEDVKESEYIEIKPEDYILNSLDIKEINYHDFLRNYYSIYNTELYLLDNETLLMAGYFDDVRRSENSDVNNITKTFKIMKVSHPKAYIIEEFIRKNVNTSLIELYILALQYKEEGIEKPYKEFYIPKSDGGKRLISEPYPELKDVLKELNKTLNSAFNTRIKKKESNQFAYIEKRSIKDCATIHKNNKIMIKTDISHFFDDCKFERCRKYLEFLTGKLDWQYSKLLLNTIKCTFINPETNGLYMGSPISGVLSNMILHPAMILIKNICISEGIDCSVYADDITFSTNKENNEFFNIPRIINMCNFAFEQYKLPFELKDSKTRMIKNNNRKVVGVRINDNNETTTVRKNYMMMKSVLEHLAHDKEVTLTPQQIQGRLNYYCYLDSGNKFARLIYKYKDVLEKNGINISRNFLKDIEYKIRHRQLTLNFEGGNSNE